MKKKFTKQNKMKKKFSKQDQRKKFAIDGEGDGCVLPDVIVEDILSRLGSKTLLKLRIVCKKWRTLISSCYFRRLHNEKSLKYPNVLVLSRRRSSPHDYVLATVSLNGDVLERWDFHLPSGGTFNMLLSQWGPNNLVCFAVNGKRFIVCNPSVRRVIYLPKLPDSKKINPYGFCYLPSTNQYVIICALRPNQWQMITFSYCSNLKDLSTGGWKPITNNTSCETWDHVHDGVFVNRVFYWIGRVPDPNYRPNPVYRKFWRGSPDAWATCLLCFDLYEEKFFGVAYPAEVDCICCTLHNVNGYLHLFTRADKSRSRPSRTLWKLDDAQNQTWIKQYTIYANMANGLDIDPFLVPDLYFKPLMVGEDGEMLVRRDGFLEWYRPRDEVFTRWKGDESLEHHGHLILLTKLHNDTLLMS